MNWKYLSIRKVLLLIRLKISYQLSYFLKKDIRWGRYIALSIEPTNSCNLSCIECPTGTNALKRNKGLFSMDAFKKLIIEKKKDLIYLNFYFQGEPFINKNLPKMIEMASKAHIYTSTSTNAQWIDHEFAQSIVKSGLNRLIISIDGTTQEVYEKYRRGGQLELVLDATRLIQSAKQELKSSSPKIIYQFLVFKHNEHQIDDIKALGKKMGVDKIEIKTAQIYDYQNKTNNIPSIDRYSRYRKTSKGEYEIKSKLPHKCWRMWHSVVITQDLYAVPCCFDKDADFTIGNLKSQSIDNIEDGSSFKSFRKKIQTNRSKIEMCKNCSEGLKL